MSIEYKRPIYIKTDIKTFSHSYTRIKQRAKLKTKEDVKNFLKGVSRNGIPFSKIPKTKEFSSFFFYIKNIKEKCNKRHLFNNLYLYKDFIILVSLEGNILTVLNVDKRFEGMYDKIKSYLSKL